MKRKLSVAYAIFCVLCMLAGWGLVAWFSWLAGIDESIECLVAIVSSLAFAPTVHELGHISFAKLRKMKLVYAKFFCFKIYVKNGKKRFGFVSPFAADETQTIPTVGGNMQKRAGAYTLGGLIFSGIFLFVLLGVAIPLTCLKITPYAIWGLVPYTAYLFILNVLPLEYPGGKTDMLVYIGFEKGTPVEKNMLEAMEIQGRLYEGKSFSEIDEALYSDVPQLPENEPLFAVMLDLRYRYYLEKEEFKKAADCLNRLAQSQEYLPIGKVRELAAEFTYMHSVNGDFERAEECGKYCREYLQEESATAKRVLAAYSAAFGKTEAVATLKKQAEALLEKEPIKGVAKFEKILLSRLPSV